MSILCRDAWGARAPAGSFVEHRLERITLHHSAVVLGDNKKAPSRLRQHQRYHQDQGWPDIAYHLGVDRNGHVYDLRPAWARGDTFTEYDPTGHLLILAEGDFNQEQPSDAQLEGVALVIAWASGRYGVPIDSLAGHQDYASTSCPGAALQPRVQDLRRRAAELTANEPDGAMLCGDAGRQRVADIEAGRA